VSALLEQGFTVVGTVRSNSKGQYLKKHFLKYGDKFSYTIVEDVGKEGAFDDAVKDVDAVEHTASPFYTDAKDPDELIKPAVDGTLNILRSVAKNGHKVRRVVITSSMAAVHSPKDHPYVFTERDWNKHDTKVVEQKGIDASGSSKYQASKTYAEHEAWDFIEENKGKIKFDLATINPAYVFGPFIHEVPSVEKLNTSIAMFRSSLFVEPPPQDQLTSPDRSWVDVRDVGLMHAAALTKEEAGGERFLASAGPWTWQEILDVLHEDPDLIPDVMKGNRGAGKKDIKERTYASGEKATKVLGINFISLKQCSRDTVKAIQERGWDKK
jgi:nucleoside-diphosphate-sugar epimerase